MLKRISGLKLFCRKTLLRSAGVFCIGVILFFTYLVWSPLPYYDTGFSSISDLQLYSKTIDEFIPMDNKDNSNPVFDSYYKKKFTEGFFNKFTSKMRGFLVKIHILKKPPFSFGFLKEMLEKQIKIRQSREFKGDFVQALMIDKDTKLIVFGVVQGAFHSLVRCLDKMQSLDLISKDFKFTNENIILVFLGNVVNRSPYTTETLLTVLTLMEKNPDRVFYLKGEHEFDSVWVNHTLARELELGARFLSNEKIPLFKQVSDFFNTLPLELYTVAQFKKIKNSLPFIAMSANIVNKDLAKKLNEMQYPEFIRQAVNKKPSVMSLDKPLKAAGPADVTPSMVASIRDIQKRTAYVPMDGLRKMPPEGSAVAWTVLSSPIATYRNSLKFFNDAFCVVSFGEKFAQWKIALYSRNVMNKDLNFSAREEEFLAGVNEIDKKEVEKKEDISKKASSEKLQKGAAISVGTIKADVAQEDQEEDEKISSRTVDLADDIYRKELAAQIKDLKQEVRAVKDVILKELQKFEVADSSQNSSSKATVDKKGSSGEHSKAEPTEGKKQKMDEVVKRNIQLEESINSVLSELKKRHSLDVTIYNNVNKDPQEGQKKTTHPVGSDEKASSIALLTKTIDDLKNELKVQRKSMEEAVKE